MSTGIAEVDVKILDRAALVHTLEPKDAASVAETFKDDADDGFMPYQTTLVSQASRCCVGPLHC